MTLADSIKNRRGQTIGEATVTSLDSVLSNLRVPIDRDKFNGVVVCVITVNGEESALRVQVAPGHTHGNDTTHEVPFQHRDVVEFKWWMEAAG